CITQFDEIVAIIDQLGISVGDTDCDGLSDLEELSHGTSIVSIDTDCDNLNDAFEIKIGTDPLDDDSDNDSYFDGIEMLLGTNPNDPLDFPGSTPSSTSTTTTPITTATTTTTASTTTKTTPAIDWVMAVFLLTTISIVLAFKKKKII
ncbi:MAG: hypothetical protein KAT16_07505, partial [Candidatus Heimdallarchaeota archaeon]|nr:hypothetical protein [Candidatus Heimdallarchaeota archaeon]